VIPATFRMAFGEVPEQELTGHNILIEIDLPLAIGVGANHP
jgi:hypothetical protein